MTPNLLPVDESERLMALHRLEFLDKPTPETVALITGLAAGAVNAPVSMLSLVDSDRQWSNSSPLLGVIQIPREVSLCAHAILQREPIQIRDASADPRFASNPLVTGEHQLRSYLGVPVLSLDGFAIGALCAMDFEAREFSRQQVDTLRDFAKIIEQTIHSREQTSRVRESHQALMAHEHMFQSTFELATVGIVHTSMNGQSFRVNPRACQMLGYTAEQLRSMRFVDITHPDDLHLHLAQFHRVQSGEIDGYRLSKRYVRKDGTLFWADVSVALKRDNLGKPDYLIGVIEDITEQKQAESVLRSAKDSLTEEVARQTQRLREQNQVLRAQIRLGFEADVAQRRAERRLRMITNSIPAMIGYWNRDLRCEFANEAYRDWFGVDPDSIVGSTMQQLLREPLFRQNEPYVRMALEGHEQRFERTLTKAGGDISFTDARYIPDIDQDGAVRGFYVLVTDITTQRKMHEELEALNSRLKKDSTTDYLTNIANRRVFSERSEEAARRFRVHHEPYGLILMDLDNFKTVNDTHGHDVGDQVLMALGRILKAQIRGQRDVAARLGGEEFAVLCTGEMNPELLCQIAERIRCQTNSEVIETARGGIRVTCSFGVALSSREDQDWKGIYSRADAALYRAKKSGKNRVELAATSTAYAPFTGSSDFNGKLSSVN